MARPPEWGDQDQVEDDLEPGPPLRGVIEVEWDDWDEDRPRSRAPWIVAGVLVVAVAVVALLVVRAVNTTAELTLPTSTTVAASPATTAVPTAPTLEALQAVVPESLDTCVPPPEEPVTGTVSVACPNTGVELVTFTLFADTAARDDAFADTVATLELDPGAPGDCALADDVVHAYAGARGRGHVACRSVDRRVDIVWTDPAAPVLATLGGFGSHGAHYRFWDDLVRRADAEFPLPREQALLDDVPQELRSRCERDIELVEEAGGIVAVTCRPATGAAETVSWVRFGSADRMTAWIDARLAALGDAVTDRSDRACRLDGPGPNGELPQPWVGAGRYRQAGTTGSILCYVSADDDNVLAWTRAGSNIGSVATADGAGLSLLDLIAWWQDGGHRP